MKRSAYRYAFGAMIVALAVACSPAPAVDGNAAVTTVATPESSLAAAMEADRAFAAMAAAEGPKAAFLKYLDPTDSQRIEAGTVITGAAEVAKLFDQVPPGFALEWAPDGGHGSTSGDLAVTTGRFTVKAADQTIDQGRYVTVWRKDAAGELKAVMDLGVADPAEPIGGGAPDPDGRPG